MTDTPKKRRKKYCIDQYDDIQHTMQTLFTQIAKDEEQDYQKVNALCKLLDLRLKALKQHELQQEINKLNEQLENWKANGGV